MRMGSGAAPSLLDQVIAMGPLAAYDLSVLSSLFKDSAMTTPVTAATDPVGAVMDLSGNAHHLLQATSAARPQYLLDSGRPYIVGDGTDDCMVSNNIDLTGTDAITVIMAVRKVSDAAIKTMLSINGAGNQSPLVKAPSTASLPRYAVYSRGTSFQTAIDFGAAARINNVLSAEVKFSVP